MSTIAWARSAQPATRYAGPSAAGSGDCSRWASACTLQTALANADGGDEIWVKAAVHEPGTNRTDTLLIKSGVKLYGGFAGIEAEFSQRRQTNLTIMSGDIDNNDTDSIGDGILDLSLGSGDAINGSNFYHVVSVPAEASSKVCLRAWS